MTATGERARGRVLVALDASRASLDALSAAAALAVRLGADLEGLFVEDVNLLRAAGFPFASQLSLPTGVLHPLDRLAIEVELRALAAGAREAIAAAAQQLRIGWTFRVARGQVSVELLEAAGSADVLVLGRSSYRIGTAAGGTARAAAAHARSSVLVVGRGGSIGKPLLVAYDGSPAADRALDVAARLDGSAGELTVLVTAPTPEQAERLAERARRRLEREGQGKGQGQGQGKVRWIVAARREDLVRAARASGALLVLGAASPALGGAGLDVLLDEIESPLLLVR